MRDVLVHIKDHEEWSHHIDYAIDTAKSFKARLRGMISFGEASMMRSMSRFADSAITEQVEKDKLRAAVVEASFRKACTTAGVQCDFGIAEGPAGEVVPWAARFHALTIIEQRDPRRDEMGYDPAEESALSAGRPVLLVPRIGHFQACPPHVVVAWNGSQQAAAAVQGALPFIANAARVTV